MPFSLPRLNKFVNLKALQSFLGLTLLLELASANSSHDMKGLSFCGGLLALILSQASTFAQTAISDYQGNWKLLSYQTPSRWVETYLNPNTQATRTSADQNGFAGPNELLVDIYYPADDETLTADVTIATGGAISGDFSGSSQAVNGRLVTSVASESFTFFPALGAGLIVGIDHEQDAQQINVFVKQEGIASGSEMAGTWRFLGYSTPSKLKETFMAADTSLRFGTDDKDSAQPGEQLVDVNYSEDPEILTGSLTLDSSGGVSGDQDGSYVVNGSDGRVALTITGDSTYPLVISPNREVMMGIFQDGLVQDFNVLIKQGANPSLGEIAGSWRVCSFSAPTRIIKNGNLLDAYLSSDYEARNLALRINADGSAKLDGESGTVAVAGPAVVLSIDGDDFTVYPTISRGVMVGVHTTSDEQELIMLVREPRLDVELTSTDLSITWGGMANALLQSSGNLSSWDNEETLTPNSSVTKSTSGGTVKFYRVVSP
jgi:hypothetical protein